MIRWDLESKRDQPSSVYVAELRTLADCPIVKESGEAWEVGHGAEGIA
jgi:hypothetical protein